MKIAIPLLTVVACILIIYNLTNLNYDAVLEGESVIALITIFASLCAILLLQILRVSKKIEKLDKRKK